MFANAKYYKKKLNTQNVHPNGLKCTIQLMKPSEWKMWATMMLSIVSWYRAESKQMLKCASQHISTRLCLACFTCSVRRQRNTHSLFQFSLSKPCSDLIHSQSAYSCEHCVPFSILSMSHAFWYFIYFQCDPTVRSIEPHQNNV